MADIIIRRAERVVLSSKQKILKEATIVISDGKVVELTEGGANSGRVSADEVIDGRGKLVVPGLINAHVHTDETLGMGIVPDTIRHVPWFENWTIPYYTFLSEEDAYYAALLSHILMLQRGITCYADSANRFPFASARAAFESGIRAFVARWTCDIGKNFSEPIDQCTRHTEELLKKFQSGRVRALASVIGLNQCSNQLYISIKDVADTYNVPITSHESSGHEDVQKSLKRIGRRPVENLSKIGFLSPKTLISHATDISDPEVRLLAKTSTKICLCPSSELKKGKGLFHFGKLPLMIRSGLNFCLGTDTANSSNHLDILRTANLLLLISKDFAMDPKILNAQRAFDMVTAEGGSCLSLGSDEALGRIEPGREADIAIFDLDNLEWFSETDPIQWLLYGSTPKTHATIVSGKIAYAEGRFSLGSSLQKIMQQCRKRAIRIRDSINHQTD